jgi:hypothetical protein
MNGAGPRSPSVAQGIGVAVVCALGGGAVFAALTLLVAPNLATRLLTTLLGGGYVLYLLACSGQRTGRIVAVVAWCGGATAAAWLIDSLALFLILHVAMIWLLRCLYFHDTIVAVLTDLALSALALAAATWTASSTASMVLSIWCLFLVQALFVVLPTTRAASTATADDSTRSEFERARRSAQAALRRLDTIH